MSSVDDLGNKVKRLKDQLREAQASYDAARIAEYPVKIGQIYKNRKGQRGQVTKIYVRYDTVRALVSFFKVDGTVGLRSTEMHDWDKWELVGERGRREVMEVPTKEFPTADVLSTVTGRLMGKIDGVYEVLNWMTGESVYTHQIPRISKEARPVMISARPDLATAISEAGQVNQDNYREWLARWVDRYGETIAVPKFTADSHERIDPISELAEHVHPDKIVVVKS